MHIAKNYRFYYNHTHYPFLFTNFLPDFQVTKDYRLYFLKHIYKHNNTDFRTLKHIYKHNNKDLQNNQTYL